MLLVASTLSQREAECSKPAYLHNACRTLAELWKETDCHCAPYHRDVWRSGGIGPRVINLWHNIDVCVELRAQARTPKAKLLFQHPLDRSYNRQSWYELCRENNILTLPGIEPRFLSRSAGGLVTVRTEPCMSVTERRKTKLIMCTTGVMWYLACISNLFAPHTHTHMHVCIHTYQYGYTHIHTYIHT